MSTEGSKFSKVENYRLSGNVIVTHWHTDIGVPPEEHWCLYVVIGNTPPIVQESL